jgi:hypothetical protein
MAIPAKGKVRVKKSWGLIAAKAMHGKEKLGLLPKLCMGKKRWGNTTSIAKLWKAMLRLKLSSRNLKKYSFANRYYYQHETSLDETIS